MKKIIAAWFLVVLAIGLTMFGVYIQIKPKNPYGEFHIIHDGSGNVIKMEWVD